MMEQNNNKKKIRAIKLHELKEVKNLNDYVLLHDNPNKKSFFQQIAYKSVVNIESTISVMKIKKSLMK